MRRVVMAAGLLAALFAASTFAQTETPPGESGDAVLGEWTTEKEESIFTFYREGDKYFGRIEWMLEPVFPPGDPEEGKPKRDRENPDKTQRNVPLQDLVFLKNFHYKDGKWVGGTIYDPTAGDTYKCQLKIEDGTLRVRGYIGVPLLGRTVEWHRPTEELKALAAKTPPIRP